jgi:hypothetical protein
MDLLKGGKLDQTLIKFIPLGSPGIRKLITSLKHRPNTSCYIDCILKLKVLYNYDCI